MSGLARDVAYRPAPGAAPWARAGAGGRRGATGSRRSRRQVARAPEVASGAALAFPRTMRGSPRGMTDDGPGVAPFPPAVRRRRSACTPVGMLGIILLALFPAADPHTQPRIGRLFSSPEQRIELDRLRDGPDLRTEAEPAAGKAGPGPRPEPASGPPALPLTVNGVVLRSDGHRVAWINGAETATGTTSPAGARIDAAPGRGLRIRWPGGRTSAALEPGQTIDAKGRVRDAYEQRATPGGPPDGAPGRSGGRAADPDTGEAGEGAAVSPGAAEPASPPVLPLELVRELLRRTPAGSAPPGAAASGVPPAGGG